MKPSRHLSLLLCLSAFYILHSTFFISCAAAQQPLLPADTGTYYYDKNASTPDNHVYISTTGTYYYVDSAGITTTGGEAPLPVTTPYQVIITTGGTANFQFNNTHASLYTIATGTDGNPRTSYAARSGTWRVNDTTFSSPSSSAAVISVQGHTITGGVTHAHPATFIGTNVNAIVENATASGCQALYLRNGAEVFIYGGTIAKTVIATGTVTDTAAGDTISFGSTQVGQAGSSHLHGENLTIIADGPNIRVLSMYNGNNTITLNNTTIIANTRKTNTGEAFLFNETLGLGGNHFTGTNLLITNNSGRVFAFGMGDNTVTLHGSTVINDGTGAVFGWNSISGTERRSFAKGSFVTLTDTAIITTASYAPVFQMIGDWGGATVTGGTLSTAGVGSTILRLVAQNAGIDHAKFIATFENTILEALQGSVIDINIEAANSANYGQAGGAGKQLSTSISDAFDIIIRSSTVTGGAAALRMAAAGGHATPYAERTYLFLHDSLFSGGIQMVAGGGINETSGAYLTFTASNSRITGGLSITGTEAARLSNQAVFHLYDSAWTGDITLTNRGNLTLNLRNTPIDGALSLSGSTWASLNLTNSSITNGVSATGHSTLAGHLTGSGAIGPVNASGHATIDLDLARIPSGPITATGSSNITLHIGNALLATDATLPGGIHLSGNATLAITLRDATRFTGDLNIHDRATLALATTSSAPLALDGNVALAGIWRITGKTTLTGSLTLADPLGTIAIENARDGSLVLANGLVNNGRLDILSIHQDALKEPEIRVIHDQTGAFTTTDNPGAPLVLAHPVDYGLAAYTLENRPGGAYLVGGLHAGSYGTGGAAIFNSRALLAEDWFAALAPLDYRLAQLRQTDTAPATRARGDTGSFWFQSRFDKTRVDRPGSSLDFTSRTLGLTAGIDTRWDFEPGTLAIGVFADTARTARDFIGSADGLTTAAGGGLYAHYLHKTGLHASAIARFDTYENTFDTRHANNAMSADYHTQAAGLALEAGYRIDLPSGWWLEPSAQAAFATLPGVSYTTKSNRPANIIDISTTDASATQMLGRLAIGKTLDKNWRLRGHLAYATINSSGGTFSASGLIADFTIAGSRAEASLGIIRNLGRTGRLTLDATCTAASDYKRPCSLHLGWGMNW